MCGLFGFAGRLATDKRKLLLRALCVFNGNRGKDSVGLVRIDRGRKPLAYRDTLPPEWSINEKDFVQVCDDAGQVWIGHTRQATRGDVTPDNAHPFCMGDTVLAHNGVVHVDKELIDRCDGRDFPVDSQYLCYLINRDNKVGEVSGYAALTFSQAKSAVDVSLIRHHAPLHCVSLSNKRGIVWSSDIDHLNFSLAIAGIQNYTPVKLEDCTRYDVYLTETGKISDVLEYESGMNTSYNRVVGFQGSQHYRDTCGGYSSSTKSADGRVVYSYPTSTYVPNGKGTYVKTSSSVADDDATVTGALRRRIEARESQEQMTLAMNSAIERDDSEAYGDALQRMQEAERLEREYYGDGAADDCAAWNLPDGTDTTNAKLPRELR